MTQLKKISLTQYRNFDAANFSFEAPVIGITGNNGVGKTNLLDAIYYLCYTKSYFQSRESYNVQNGREGFRLHGSFITPGNQEEEISCVWRDNKKELRHDQVLYQKVTEHIGKYNAVMIAPDDIELINGSSELRRKFIDGLLAQSDPAYLENLLAYQKYLAQRNAYLKQTTPATVAHDLLDVYDAQLELHGKVLIAQREQLSAVLPEWLRRYYAALSGDAEPIGMQYKRCAAAEELGQAIHRSRQRDIEYRRSLTGPHTEDWTFLLEGNPLRNHGSQGQKKSFLIGLKLAHIHWLIQLGKQPILLLDDIFEKLDQGRLNGLFGLLQQFELAQIFITHTSAADFDRAVPQFYEQSQVIRL